MYVSPYEQIFADIRNDANQNLRSLIDADASVLDAQDERGSTPLVLAAYLNNLPATKILVESGANIDQPGSTGTALMGASFKGHLEIVKYLLEQGADTSLVHSSGHDALGFAKMGGNAKMVALLTQK